MAKSVLGIDIGNFSLKAAEWRGDVLKEFASFELPENLVKSDEVVAFEALGEFIRKEVRKHFSTRDVALVLPAPVSYVRRLKLPLMTISQLNSNLPYEFHDIVKDDADKYLYDYSVIDRIQVDGKEYLDMTAAAVSKELIAKYSDMFRRAGFKLVKISPREISLGHLIQVVSPFEKGKDFATLDLGYETTKVDIFKGGVYDLTRTLDLGVSHIEAAAANVLHCDRHLARIHVRDNTDNVLDSEQVRNIMDEVAVEVMRAVNYYTYENPDNTLENFYVYGGGARLPQYTAAIQSAVPLNLMSSLQTKNKYNINDSLNDGLAAVAIGMKLGGTYGN
ncbi:MAG: pilus assembly protein PilM [Saccharofermentans sp.]|nr:pilus assembly protein PilM [Mageeibacillus sp.]MCI1263775.1 pilus assembly protein PilM [Saccharofermentans sp.]MCI1274758.1 pilus assembly protein PilM [Saccharofermentans sp.]MCI2044728.1 pilus assembly protein PilM [Mageeibacillus sp.]